MRLRTQWNAPTGALNVRTKFYYIYPRRPMSWRRKIAPFATGVMVGLLAGVAFFVFKINDWFVKLRDTANERITVIEQPVREVPEKKETPAPPPREKMKIRTGKSQRVNYREVDSLIRQNSQITVATEELLSTKNVKVIKVADNSADATTDTAAANAGVKPDPVPETIQVEFWKTPLNSRGYRFSRNKVMLYGFPDFSNVLVYELGGAYFLRSSDQIFRLSFTAEFKPMEKVTDPELLSRLS